MKEKIYMVKHNGDLLLWTNLRQGFPFPCWHYMAEDDWFIFTYIDESLLEYIGEL